MLFCSSPTINECPKNYLTLFVSCICTHILTLKPSLHEELKRFSGKYWLLTDSSLVLQPAVGHCIAVSAFKAGLVGGSGLCYFVTDVYLPCAASGETQIPAWKKRVGSRERLRANLLWKTFWFFTHFKGNTGRIFLFVDLLIGSSQWESSMYLFNKGFSFIQILPV